ncbi:acyltransferase family domain-containing protein [Phthorimaea operculella]|nr:acyltransferase family domain-containing protein [Phthorimaea operculella]
MRSILLLCIFDIIFGVQGSMEPVFDKKYYEQFLDPVLCQEQLAELRNNTSLAAKFIEAGLRIPKGITDGNFVDYGNYYQCININENVGNTNVEGKHCRINVPLNQTFQLPFSMFDSPNMKIDETFIETLQKYRNIQTTGDFVDSRKIRSAAGNDVEYGLQPGLTMALCIPKSCTTEEWMNGFIFNISSIGFQYSEVETCRLKNDKPWVPADYVAVVIFSIILFLTLISTSYDVWQTVILKNDRKSLNPLHCSFSVYTNTRRLTTITKNPGALECLDGIRAISMVWVILGHTFSTYHPARLNVIDTFMWSLSLGSTWVTAAPISVDTFYMMSGLLLVYTAAGKFTGMKLLKNVHLFYINRLLRMFPLLAATVLIQTSFLYRLSDGPAFDEAAYETSKCRASWWSTLLYVQNYVNPLDMCLGHTWYLAVDMHCYLLSPLVLFWVFGRKKRMAWTALTIGLLAVLIPSTIYTFVYEFPSSVVTANRITEFTRYMQYYYLNTLTRAPPFFVGMLFGYLLYVLKGKKLILSKSTVFGLWFFVLGCMSVGIFAEYPAKKFDWDNQVVDSLINSFLRVFWTGGIGILIVFCVHGYGGPLDWFLSLNFWKLPSRLSYGMYLFHFQIMFVTASSALAPVYFSEMRAMYRFVSEMSLALVVSFIATVLIDSPFSVICKQVLGGGPRTPPSPENQLKDNEKNGTLSSNSTHKIDFVKL